MQSVPDFSPSGVASQPDRWWTAFADEALNEHIDRALAENYTLAAAAERLQQSRAIARQARAALFPVLDGIADVEHVESSDSNDSTAYVLGLQASYEIDLWGRIEATVDAERFRAAASLADYETAAISLAAEVALTWYQLTVTRLQLELIESQLETNRTVLEVLERRFAVGQSGSADVLRQRQLVEATREQLIITRSQVDVFEHALAVLEGRPPQADVELPPAALPEIAPMPATGLPAALLQRRPDVRSAFLRIQAAGEDIAAAVADQYPRLNLFAALTTSAESPSNLFMDWVSSLAGQLTAPLFDAERRTAEVQRTVALRRQRLAEYGQTVLDALADVEDALAREEHQHERIASLELQLTLALETYNQLRNQYLNGAADFIDVLTALSQQQQIERDVLTARLDLLGFRIALYRALAGGFALDGLKE